jgi:hypothetical protein
MKTERMPWTCRWSEYRPATPPPIWMTDWLAQWACLADEGRPVSDPGRCDRCRSWEPRYGWAETGVERGCAPMNREGQQRG